MTREWDDMRLDEWRARMTLARRVQEAGDSTTAAYLLSVSPDEFECLLAELDAPAEVIPELLRLAREVMER